MLPPGGGHGYLGRASADWAWPRSPRYRTRRKETRPRICVHSAPAHPVCRRAARRGSGSGPGGPRSQDQPISRESGTRVRKARRNDQDLGLDPVLTWTFVRGASDGNRTRVVSLGIAWIMRRRAADLGFGRVMSDRGWRLVTLLNGPPSKLRAEGVKSGQDDLVTDLTCDVSLVVIDSEVPDDEIRRWWNCKETPLLYDLVATAPRLRLGRVLDKDGDDVPGPARRVFSLLFLRGTTPRYVVPRLDDELIGEILAAYQGRDDDAPGTQQADLAEVAAFLATHRGAGVLTGEDEEP